jgi:hypothetical protein
MKEIKLVNSEKIALIDDEDYDRVNQYKWFLREFSDNRNTFYIYRATSKEGKNITLHNFILENVSKGNLIDHKDRNGLNCQKDNLRVATKSQNRINAVKNKTNKDKKLTSKYKGVSLCKNKWMVKLANKYLGVFTDEKTAALAYNTAALEKFGEFALLNIIEDD